MSIKFQGNTIAGNVGIVMDKQIYHAVLQPDGRTYIIQEDIQFVLNQIRFIHFDNINTAPKPVIKYGWIRANTPGLYSKELVDWIRRDLDAYIIPGNSLLAIGLVDSDTAKLQMLFFDIFNKAKITALETSVTTNTQDITTLNTSVTTNTEDITTLETGVTTNTQDITTLKTDVATNTQDITTLKTSVTTNTQDITTLKTDVATNTQDITTLETSVTTNTQDITTHTQDITTLKTDVATNTQSIDSLESSTLTVDKADMSEGYLVDKPKSLTTREWVLTQIEAVTGVALEGYVDVDQFAAFIRDTIDPTFLDFETDITANTQAINTLGTDVTTNTQDITTLKTSVTTNTQDITTLNTDVTTNTQNITTLGTDVATNTQAITALETDVANNKYTHPSTHPATIITQDTTHRFVTDAEKTLWNRGVSPYHLATISSSGPTSLTTADLNAYSLILVELQLKPTSTFSDNISVHTVSKIVTPEQFSYSQREDTKGICYINDVPNLDIHMAPQCTTQGGEWRQTPITYTAFGGVALYFENSSTVNVSDTVILSKAYLKVSSQNGELTVYMPTSGNSNYTIQMHIYGIE